MLLVALSALPVAAQAGPIVEGAAEALRQDPIYVHPDADLSAQDADGIHEQLRTAEAGPVYIAVLPVEAADEAGGDAGQVLQLVGESVGRQGTYAVVVGNQLRAGATPERRAPCFFDPAHGPSVGDVEWAPAGGVPRNVPACQADTVRIQRGEEPLIRQVTVGGSQHPYWDTPA